MSWSLVQHPAPAVPNAASATVSFAQPVAAGHLLVLEVTTGQPGAPTLSDTTSGAIAWQLIDSVAAPGSWNYGATLWRYWVDVPTTTSNLAVTASVGQYAVAVAAREFDPGTGVTVQLLGHATATSPAVGPITWAAGLDVLVVAAAANVNYGAGSVSSTTDTVDDFHDFVYGSTGLLTLHHSDDYSGSATPSITSSNGTDWLIGGAAFGAIATSSVFDFFGPSVGVVGVACGPFTVRLGAPAPSGGVTITLGSDVGGDTLPTPTIPAGQAQATFLVDSPSAGLRHISASIPGYTGTGTPLAYTADAPATGSLHATGQCQLANTSGPGVSAFGGQAAFGIGLRACVTSATGTVTLAGWQGGPDTLLSYANGVATFSLTPAAGSAWTGTFPMLSGVVYHLLWTASGFYLNRILYSACPFGGTATHAYSGLTIGPAGTANVELADVAIWTGYTPTGTEALDLAEGTITPSQTATPAAVWWSLGGTLGGSPSIGDAGFIDLAGNGNTLAVTSGSLSNATYGPALATTDPVSMRAYIWASGTGVKFEAEANQPGTSGRDPLAPLSAVATAPTVYDAQSRACTLLTPAHYFGDWNAIVYPVGFGQVWKFLPADGGAGLPDTVTPAWNGDGGGTSLTLPTLSIGAGIEAGIAGWVVEDGGAWPSLPTVTVTRPQDSWGSAGGSPAYAVGTLSGHALTSVSPYPAGLLGCGRRYDRRSSQTVSVGAGYGLWLDYTLDGTGKFTAITPTSVNGDNNGIPSSYSINIWDSVGARATVPVIDGTMGALPAGAGYVAPCFTVVPIYGFTAGTTSGSPTVAAVSGSTIYSLAPGQLVSGPGIPAGATVSAIGPTFAGNTTSGSAVVVGISSTAGLSVGMGVVTTNPYGLYAATVIHSIDSSSQVTLSQPFNSDETGQAFQVTQFDLSANATATAAGASLSATTTTVVRAIVSNYITEIPLSFDFAGDTTSGSTAVTGIPLTANLAVGMVVTGLGVAAGTTIAVVGSGQVTLSSPATATAKAAVLCGSHSSHDFVSPPTITIPGSPTRAPSMVASMRAVPGDAYTYSAPASWWTPTYNGLALGGVRAVSGASLGNYAERDEPGVYSLAPTIRAGTNIGEVPIGGHGGTSWSGRNRLLGGDSWLTLGGDGSVGNTPVPTVSVGGVPSPWGGNAGLSRAFMGGYAPNNLDPMGEGGPIGEYTLVYEDLSGPGRTGGVNTSAANVAWLTAAVPCVPVSKSGPNSGTQAPATIPAANVTVSGGSIQSVSLAGVTLGSGWQGALALATTTGSGRGAILLAICQGGAPTQVVVLNGGINYDGTTEVDLYGTAVSGSQVTIGYAVSYADPSPHWWLSLALNLANAACTWSLGRYAVSAPDPATGGASPPDLSDPMAPDPGFLDGLTAPGGLVAGPLRAMDADQSLGANSNWVEPDELPTAATDDLNPSRQVSAWFTKARFYNTDPAKGPSGDGTYAWASPKVYGRQPGFGSTGEAVTIPNCVLTQGSTTVSVVNPQIMVGSTVTGPAGYLSAASPAGNALYCTGASGPGFSLSMPALQSGTVTLTVQYPDCVTLTPGDAGAWLNSGFGSHVLGGAMELDMSPVPHGLAGGRQYNLYGPGNAGSVPFTSCSSAFLPTTPGVTYAWPSGPCTMVIAPYLQGYVTGSPTSFQTVVGTSEIDLTNGGAASGWKLYQSLGGQSQPYEYHARTCASGGISPYVNLSACSSLAMAREVGYRFAVNGCGNLDLYLEWYNEPWNHSGGQYWQWPNAISSLLSIAGNGVAPYFTSTGSAPGFQVGGGDFLPGVWALLLSALSDAFKQGFQAGSGDPTRVKPVANSWFWGSGPGDGGITQAAARATAEWGLPIWGVNVGPYHDFPSAEPSFVAAIAPLGSQPGAGGNSVAFANDLYRHYIPNSDYIQGVWWGHSGYAGNLKVCGYEGGMEWCGPGGTPAWGSPHLPYLMHDAFYDRSWERVVRGFYLGCQQGKQDVAGSGADFQCYYQDLVVPTWGAIDWKLRAHTGQLPGDGLGNAYTSDGTVAWAGGPNRAATPYGAAGSFADGRAHDVANASTAIAGLRPFFTTPTPTPTPTSTQYLAIRVGSQVAVWTVAT